MKKFLLTIVLFAIALNFVFAQGANVIGSTGNVGIDTSSAPYSLTLSQQSSGIAHYYYSDGGSANYARLKTGWVGGVYNIGTYFGGTVTSGKAITIGVQSSGGGTTLNRAFTINPGASVATGNFNFVVSTGNTGSIVTLNTGLIGGAKQNMFSIQGTVSQTGTSSSGGYTALLITPHVISTDTAGNNYLIDAGVNSGSSGTGTHTSYMVLTAAGKMGIGTTDPGAYMLAVKGNIHAQQVNIDMINWGDYVFNPTYKLRPLAEVKTYIDKNHHLPEIPSEAEMIKNGLDVGEMNKMLMKKVEELTLYVIAKDKQIEEQNALIKAQQAMLLKLQQNQEDLNKKVDSIIKSN